MSFTVSVSKFSHRPGKRSGPNPISCQGTLSFFFGRINPRDPILVIAERENEYLGKAKVFLGKCPETGVFVSRRGKRSLGVLIGWEFLIPASLEMT
jgi:hypothetical protein